MVDTTTTAATAETHASTEAAHGGAESHAKPKALGMDATMWVALAMLVVIGLAVWKKVPAVVTGALDKQIAAIKEQLDKATALRAEAEAIKAEYLAKARQAERDAEDIRKNAEAEAKLIVSKAKSDASELITRRQAMAEQKIGAAESEAIAGIRAQAANTAAAAAELLIAQQLNAAADGKLVDQTIASLN